MEIREEQIYNQIKQKNPYLNHFDILRIQNKIISKLSDRGQKIAVNTRFHNERNLRNIHNYDKSEYIPRIEQPKFQSKIHRNELEDNYQDFYKQRNDYNQKEYVSGIKKNGLESQGDLFYQDDTRRNFLGQNISENHLKNTNSNQFEKSTKLPFKSDQSHNEELRIFNLKPSFTLNELKNSYKKLTLQHHPDRGGDVNIFRLITQAFNNLSESYQKRQSDKQFNQLKSDFNSYTENQEKTINTQIDSDKFNLETFNRLYQNNRLENNNDRGYGDWKSTNDSETNERTISKFEIGNFNESFQSHKNNSPQQQQLINYQEPQPSTKGTMMNYSEIDDKEINDFSSGVDSNLKFTDYKQAHTNNNLIDINKVKFKEYKNVDDLESERSNLSYQMTSKQMEDYNIQKKKEQQEEEQRLRNIKSQDDKYEHHFNKMNKLLLNNFQSR